MGKWWSLLFGVVMLGCLGLFVAAPFVTDENGNHIWWLPVAVSTHADRVDHLFYIILGITGFFFILTEALLVIFMFQYAGRPKGQHVFGAHPYEEKVYWTSFFKQAFRPVSAILHDQHRVELTWTLIPAAILLYIAFAQVGTWLEIKDKSRQPSIGSRDSRGEIIVPLQIEVSARQFEWRVRYPASQRLEKWLNNPKDKAAVDDFSSFTRYPQQDDVHFVNEVHLWKEHPLLVQLKTIDVIHSFNIPYMRVKQDALPGKTIPVWFTPTRANTRYDAETKTWQDGIDLQAGRRDTHNYRWEIACAELCGWGHHRMIGRVYVHESRETFLAWLKQMEQREDATRPAPIVAAAR